MSIAEVIGWKFSNQPGMRCAEINSVMRIVEFPGGIPSQAEQDAWTAEYQAYLSSDARKNDDAQRELDGVKALKALVLLLIDKGVFTLAELRAKYRSLP